MMAGETTISCLRKIMHDIIFLYIFKVILTVVEINTLWMQINQITGHIFK